MTIEDFQTQLRIKNSSNKTIQTYLKQIRPFLKFCDGEVTQDNINKYLINRRETVSTSSCNLFINALKKYCEYAGLEFEIPKQKSIKMKYYHSWTIEEFENDILQYVHGEDDLILRFMFFTGLRPNEIINIKKQHIDYKKEIVIVKDGKGEKDRFIPFLDTKLYNDLKVYMEGNNRDTIFDTNEQQLQYLFKRLKQELSIEEEISPYTMRRSFACYCKRNKIDITDIKDLMGHEDIKTTERYVKSNPKTLIETCKEIRR